MIILTLIKEGGGARISEQMSKETYVKRSK